MKIQIYNSAQTLETKLLETTIEERQLGQLGHLYRKEYSEEYTRPEYKGKIKQKDLENDGQNK